MTPLDAMMLDALREVSSIGCGHAATAFARMLGGRVLVSAPESAAASREELERRLGGEPAPVLIGFDVFALGHDGQRGTAMIILVFSPTSARELGAAMVQGSSPLGDDALAAITEMGNILASSYLNAVSRLAQLTLIPSVPMLDYPTARQLPARLAGAPPEVMVESTFFAEGGTLRSAFLTGKVLLLGTRDSLKPILGGMGLTY